MTRVALLLISFAMTAFPGWPSHAQNQALVTNNGRVMDPETVYDAIADNHEAARALMLMVGPNLTGRPGLRINAREASGAPGSRWPGASAR